MDYKEYLHQLESRHVPHRDIGLVLAYSLSQHRDNSDKYYGLRTKKHFANQENEWMLRGLGNLLSNPGMDLSSLEAGLEQFIPKPPIFCINFVCDIVQFYYRNCTASKDVFEFLAETSRAAVFGKDFDSDKDGIIKHEYNAILRLCRRNIEKRFRIKLQAPYNR